MYYVSLSDFCSWIEAIVNTACLREPSNALVVSEGVWNNFRPLFRMAITFFFFLSFSTLASLAMINVKKKAEIESKGYKKYGSISDSLTKLKEVPESELKEMATNLLAFAVFLFVIVLGLSFAQSNLLEPPEKACDEVLHHGNIKLVAGKNFKKQKYGPSLGLAVAAIVLCCLVLKANSRYFKNLHRFWHHVREDLEAGAFLVFGLGALVYYSGAIIVHSIWQSSSKDSTTASEMATAVCEIFACLLQIASTVLFAVSQKENYFKWYKCRAILCFFLLFTFMSQLGVNLVQEEFDPHIHHSPFLHGSFSLVVDFRLSGVILAFENLSTMISWT